MTPPAHAPQLLEHSAPYYDAIYATKAKSYREEAERVTSLVGMRSTGAGDRPALLDVACGTGEHLRFLSRHYDVCGVDLSPWMLAVARRKLPDVAFHLMDMRDLDLPGRFDVVTCLFSAVGYLPDEEGLRRAVNRMARHLKPGGVLLLEPALTPERVQPARVSTLTARQGAALITRTTSAARIGGMLNVRFDYAVSNGAGDRRFIEIHAMKLFPRQVYVDALEDAGLVADADEHGVSGVGAFIGCKSA